MVGDVTERRVAIGAILVLLGALACASGRPAETALESVPGDERLPAGEFSAEVAVESATAVPSEEAIEEYLIGAGDVLDVDVFGLGDLDRRARVSVDGTISLPLLGAVGVSGLSLRRAEEKIARVLSERKLVREPEVSIFVAELVSRAVSVQGAVGSPGTYQLSGRETLLDIIGQSGGMNRNAGRNIVVLRGSGGDQHRIEIDADKLMGGDPSADIPLRRGDIIMVAPAQRARVYVSGAVKTPGVVEFWSSEGLTVLQAITAAGGPTNRAKLKKTHVLRRLPGGGQERIEVNVDRIQQGKEEDLALRRNDTVVVGESFF